MQCLQPFVPQVKCTLVSLPLLHSVIPCGVLGGALEYSTYADTANAEGLDTLEVEYHLHHAAQSIRYDETMRRVI